MYIISFKKLNGEKESKLRWGVAQRTHLGPAAPQTPNQQTDSSSWPLPPQAATRQQGCGKTPPLAPLALQYLSGLRASMEESSPLLMYKGPQRLIVSN